jgi:hypothetical protein
MFNLFLMTLKMFAGTLVCNKTKGEKKLHAA